MLSAFEDTPQKIEKEWEIVLNRQKRIENTIANIKKRLSNMQNSMQRKDQTGVKNITYVEEKNIIVKAQSFDNFKGEQKNHPKTVEQNKYAQNNKKFQEIQITTTQNSNLRLDLNSPDKQSTQIEEFHPEAYHQVVLLMQDNSQSYDPSPTSEQNFESKIQIFKTIPECKLGVSANNIITRSLNDNQYKLPTHKQR